jgi:hypothetical protein
MTFITGVYAVDGNTLSSQILRMALAAATSNQQGVVGPLDCIVNATTPSPTAGITIGAGSAVIFGAETTDQGAYMAYNPGLDTSLTIASTGGTIRSDMVVLRAEDPTWSASPWGNPAAGQIVFPRVISNVSAGATQPPGGQSCIPLARIDMPVSTSTVQQSYIHDLRGVADPFRLRTVLTAAGPGSPSSWTVGTSPTAWPTQANWSVAIPSWATSLVAKWTITDLIYTAGGTNVARGSLQPIFGSSVAAPALTTVQSLISISSTATYIPISASGGFAVAIPASLRGTTQTLQMSQVTDGTNTGIIQIQEGSLITMDIEFQQLASLT